MAAKKTARDKAKPDVAKNISSRSEGNATNTLDVNADQGRISHVTPDIKNIPTSRGEHPTGTGHPAKTPRRRKGVGSGPRDSVTPK